MNKKILDILNTTSGQLIFVLLAGLGYFMVLAGAIIEMSRGMWTILLFFAPVIICGSALVLIRHIKQARENKNNTAILKLFWLHIGVILIGVIFFSVIFV